MSKFSKTFNNDKLYTNTDVATNCLSYIELSKYSRVVEPAAGSGNFFNMIQHHNKIGIDIEPECDNIVKQNWFDFAEDLTDCLVIGNPPFGVRNKLSIEFIKHATKLNAATIAFILPNVFKKHTMQKHISYGISNIIEIPSDSFTYMGNAYKIPCSFFILNKNGDDSMRFDIKKYQHSDDFCFVSKSDDHDFFIMGAAPHNVKTVVETNNRGYYIKCTTDIDIAKKNFRDIPWSLFGNSSASGGVSWFTKPEIIKIYNAYVNNIQ